MDDKAVCPELLDILHAVVDDPAFEPFSLGGGTSLALRFGHRRSIDIDLFTVGGFDSERLLEVARSKWSQVALLNRTVGSLCLELNHVKVDLLHHAYPLLGQPEVREGVRVLSVADVAAMKVNAVTNRGSKKDFADLLALHLHGTPIQRSLEHFCAKYGVSGKFLAIRSLQFFGDARGEPDPIFLDDSSWEVIETTLLPLVTRLS